MNLVDPAPFVQASRELFGEHGCYPMIAIGKMQTLAAFKMLARARDLSANVSNEVSKQISLYTTDRKHAIENNSDDPDYNVDDDVDIKNYVDEKYLDLVEDSKQYQKIAVSISPHPCAHLTYNCDLRREIGVISLKPKAGSTERTLCVAIEGGPADAAGYCKQDLLRVAVVDVINKTFAAVGLKTPGVEDLKRLVDENPLVWNLYAKGYTLGLNQTEKAATTKKVMKFKPQNQVELAAFIAAIRPGAKSLVDDYVNRNPHTYGIPAMDKMLRLEGATGTTGESSWLFFDENVLHLAEAAGIDPGDAVLLIKAIKKKKADKVMHYKEAFVPGFTKYLIESENTEPELAAKTSDDVWTVIENSASYLFNSSHACAMAYDSLYGAILKLLYPYEFYRTLLQLYTDKGFKDKVALAAVEMRKYKGIQLTIGKFGQDNRDWFIDKKKKTISQALASIKGISQNTAEDLYQAAQIKHDTFVDLLRWLQMNTKVNRGHVETLIQLNYFSSFGRTAKLLKLYKEFYDGDHKVTKTIKSFEERLTYLRTIESTTYDRELPLLARLRAENMYTGMCFSEPDPGTDHDKEYLVLDIDTKYGVNVKLYNVSNGNVSTVKIRKDAFGVNPFDINDAIKIINWSERARYSYTNGIKRKTGEVDYYLEFYRVFKQSDLDIMEAI